MIYNGIYTIKSPTGTERTFKIHTATKRSKLYGKRILSIKESHNFYAFGFVNDNDTVFVWRRFKDEFHLGCASLISFYSKDNNPYLDKGVEYFVSRHCRICNKRLTTSESIMAGIGPECAKKNSL